MTEMDSPSTNSKGDVARTAGELRAGLALVVRRLHAEATLLTPAKAVVLSRLAVDGPQTTSELAARESVRSQTMAQTIRELEAEQFVSRRRNPNDRRQLLVEITKRGAAFHADDRRRREAWLARAIEQGLTTDEQALLTRAVPLLHKLAAS